MVETPPRCRRRVLITSEPATKSTGSALARLRRRAQRNLLAIGVKDVPEIQNFGAVLGSLTAHFDCLAGVELMAVPSVVNQVIGRGHLHVPLGDISIRVLNVKEDERMRLDELELGYRAGQRGQSGIVIGR